MKKLLSLFLILGMLLTLCPFSLAEEDTAEIPAVGQTVEGFTVKERRPFPMLGAEVTLFEHDRTGARLMYLANNDTNRMFDLTFLTRAIDNTGLPHVFEHATLNGSEKYPSTDLFFNLMYQTYNTYLNASTGALFTTYPMASLSEAQLLKYADFYTDSCLHPQILEKESIYREEAWRYRLENEEGDLTIEGTVYSEMLAALNIQSMSYTNLLRTAFPGSTIGNVFGGDPAFIPDMTWEDLKAYHDYYYHPSNSIAFLYGRFEDYTAFLALLNEAYEPYERKEVVLDDPGYQPLTGTVEKSFTFPAEAGSATENVSYIYYGAYCQGLGMDEETAFVLNTLTDILNADGSPLMQKLKKALPAGSFACSMEINGPAPGVMVIAQNVNPEDAKRFQSVVDEAFGEIAEKGFSQDLVDAVMNSLSLTGKLSCEDPNAGVDVVVGQMAVWYAASGNPFYYLDYVDSMKKMNQWNLDGVYADTVQRCWLNNEIKALATTSPEPGAKESQEAAEAQRLAAVKAAMTEEEIHTLVEQTNAEKKEEDTSRYVAQLQAVSAGSLPEEQRYYPLQDETGEDGVRRLTAQVDVDDVGMTLLLFDALGLPQDDLHWFALYTSLIGKMDTSAHTREELAALMDRYLYNCDIRFSIPNTFGTKEYHPYLRAGWIAADEDLATGYELIGELLFDTQFNDAETLSGLISQKKASLRSEITQQPFQALLYRGLGAKEPRYAYNAYMNYLPYYAFLEETEQRMQTEPETVIARLQAIQAFFHNKTNAIAAYAGSADGIEANAKAADVFFSTLDTLPIKAQEYVFDAPAASEALIVDSSVQYNMVIADYETMGLEGFTADMNAVAALTGDLYLIPVLREQYGVYTPQHGFAEEAGGYLLSYRDPNIRETFDAYDALPAFLAELTLDQETIDGYILSSYSQYAMPRGELNGAIEAITGKICNEPEDLLTRRMRELKTLTPEKLAGYTTAYEKMMAGGLRSTAGGAGAIGANADLYDIIFNPFGTVDTSGETATLGDLAGNLYGLIGGDPSNTEEAFTFFASNGFFREDASMDAELTGADMQEVLAAFAQAAGAEYEAPKENETGPVTKGEMEKAINDFLTGLG